MFGIRLALPIPLRASNILVLSRFPSCLPLCLAKMPLRHSTQEVVPLVLLPLPLPVVAAAACLRLLLLLLNLVRLFGLHLLVETSLILVGLLHIPP